MIRRVLSLFSCRRCAARTALVASVSFAVVSISNADDDVLNAGLLYDRFPLTLSLGSRTEMFGPLFYSEQDDTQHTWALPPLMSHTFDPITESEEFDIAYPLLTYDRYGKEYRWQLGQLLSFAGGQNQEQQRAHRFTLFPIYFQQRSPVPEENYTALVPLYGHLDHRLFRDDIFFVMFPMFSRTRKKDVVTYNYVYPIFHLRYGNNLEGWQFWPIVGHERKAVTTVTNGFGDTEIIGGHEQRFVLWPLHLDERTGLGTDNPAHQQVTPGVYSFLRSPHRDSTTVIWPFFSHVTDREKKYNEWQLPWPFVIFARGEGKTENRVFPFYSHAESAHMESAFYLWPIYKYNHYHEGALDWARTRILFFLYSDTVQKNLGTGQAQRRIDFLPFYTHKRDYNGSTRLQIFTVLEPFLPNSKSIERNYSQIWSVWRSENNTKTAASSQSLLWNLYRNDQTPESKKCSLLFGLLQYQSNPGGKRLRLFYIPVVNTRPTATAVSK